MYSNWYILYICIISFQPEYYTRNSILMTFLSIYHGCFRNTEKFMHFFTFNIKRHCATCRL